MQSQTHTFWGRVTQSFGLGSPNTVPSEDVNGFPNIGDRFAHSTNTTSVWVVENVLRVAASSYPLVRLSRENHPDIMKVVSLSALADHREFTRA